MVSNKNLFFVRPPAEWAKRPLIAPGSNEPKPQSNDAEQNQVDQWLELGDAVLKTDEASKPNEKKKSA